MPGLFLGLLWGMVVLLVASRGLVGGGSLACWSADASVVAVLWHVVRGGGAVKRGQGALAWASLLHSYLCTAAMGDWGRNACASCLVPWLGQARGGSLCC